MPNVVPHIYGDRCKWKHDTYTNVWHGLYEYPGEDMIPISDIDEILVKGNYRNVVTWRVFDNLRTTYCVECDPPRHAILFVSAANVLESNHALWLWIFHDTLIQDNHDVYPYKLNQRCLRNSR